MTEIERLKKLAAELYRMSNKEFERANEYQPGTPQRTSHYSVSCAYNVALDLVNQQITAVLKETQDVINNAYK